MKKSLLILLVFVVSPFFHAALSQISPGELASVHAGLEGISNCTKCHSMGDKVTNDKCLACHSEIKSRIDQSKGYHSSSAVRGKNCITCHSDHHGKNFQIIRFAKESFNHDLTGYALSVPHSKKKCQDCHKPEFISSKTIRSKKFTYLGLSQECLACHADYHQKTLAASCLNCHMADAFKPASKFSHVNAKFQLKGRHQQVECMKCHKVETKNGVKFQEFTGISFSNCNNCHADVHQNKFGQNCVQCHSETSFHSVKGISNFDHSRTNFKLEGKHQLLACQKCHKTTVTAPLKYGRCSDCHSDYHNNQFSRQGISPDCSSCHSVLGFTGSFFSLEQHNAGTFRLKGAHLATPCFSCHKKQEKWSFRNIGKNCTDCHQNIHQPFMSSDFYSVPGCISCHNETSWTLISFDHSRTKFTLSAPHAKQTCKSCHFKKDATGKEDQKFSGLPTDCNSCHTDIHFSQFETNGKTDCLRCHSPDQWKITTFDHNLTAFKLDGKHQNVACNKCHRNVTAGENTYVLYKIKETTCKSCH